MTEDDDTDPPRAATDGERRAHLQAARDAGIVADSVEQDLRLRVSSLEDSRKAWRWIVGLGLPSLGAAVVAILLWSVDQVRSSSEHAGESKAEIRALEKSVDQLEQYVHELLRKSELYPRRPDSTVLRQSDKLSSLQTPRTSP